MSTHGGPGRGILSFSWMTASALSGTARELSLWAQHYSVSFPFFFLSSSSKSMSAWQTEETSMWLSRPRQSDCKEGTTSHAPPQALNKPCLLPHYVLTWGKPALLPTFLTDPAVTRTKRQGHKLAHKASFCLDHGHTWYGKEKSSVALQEKTPVKQGKEKDQEQAYWTGEVSWMAER